MAADAEIRAGDDRGWTATSSLSTDACVGVRGTRVNWISGRHPSDRGWGVLCRNQTGDVNPGRGRRKKEHSKKRALPMFGDTFPVGIGERVSWTQEILEPKQPKESAMTTIDKDTSSAPGRWITGAFIGHRQRKFARQIAASGINVVAPWARREGPA